MAFVPLKCPFDGQTDLRISVEQPSARVKIDCPDCAQSVSIGLGAVFDGAWDALATWRA